MTKYFQKFPKISYKFYLDNTLVEQQLVNIQLKYGISKLVKNINGSFYKFITRDHDRIDALSHKYYGNVDRYWLIPFSNNSFDWYYDFTLSNIIFLEYLYRKYKQDAIDDDIVDTKNNVINYLKTKIHHYEDSDGFIIDLDTYTIETGDKRIVYYYDYEDENNENKRNINLLTNQLAGQAEKELNKLLNEVK